MKYFSTLLFTFALLSSSLFSQTTTAENAKGNNNVESGKNFRKSVSVIPLTLDDKESYNLLLRSAYSFSDKRFDYVEVSQRSFVGAQEYFNNQRNNYLQDSISNEKNLSFIKKVLKQSGSLKEILDKVGNIDFMRERLKKMDKKAEGVTTDAKEAKGLEYDVGPYIRKFIETTYIGIPVLHEYKKNQKGGIAKGNIYWFNVKVSPEISEGTIPNANQVELVLAKSTTVEEQSYADSDGSSKDIDLKNKAIYHFSKKLFNTAYSMDEFKIRAMIQAAADKVKIDLGDREGAYLDQGYKIYRNRMNKKGDIYSEYMGFVRIDNLGKTSKKNDALSTMYSIKPGDFSRGQIGVSHDQLFDLYIRPSYRFLNVPAQSVNWFSQSLFDNSDANLLSDDATTSYNVNLGFMYNLARYIGVNQFFVGIDAGIGFLGTTANAGLTTNGSEVDVSVNTPMTIEASFLIHKKFWFAPFAAFAEAQFGFNSLEITGDITYNDQTNDWELNYGTFNYAAGLVLGLDYAINADMLAGIEAGYRYSFPITELEIIDTDGEKSTYKKSDNEEFWKANEIEDIQLGGIKFGIHFCYMLPPLF